MGALTTQGNALAQELKAKTTGLDLAALEKRLAAIEGKLAAVEAALNNRREVGHRRQVLSVITMDNVEPGEVVQALDEGIPRRDFAVVAVPDLQCIVIRGERRSIRKIRTLIRLFDASAAPTSNATAIVAGSLDPGPSLEFVDLISKLKKKQAVKNR
jgi:hypothetical protein